MSYHWLAAALGLVFLPACEISRSRWESGHIRVTVGGVAIDPGQNSSEGAKTGDSSVANLGSAETHSRPSTSSEIVSEQAPASSRTVTSTWERQPERHEQLTGRVRANLELSRTPLILTGRIVVQGRASWEQEAEPWFIHTRTSKIDGKVIDTKKVVDPPKFMNLCPDHDERLSASDIPAAYRQSTAAVWRHLSTEDARGQVLEWELDSTSELSGSEVTADKVKIDPNGYFSIELPESTVRKLHTMAADTVALKVEASGSPFKAAQVVVLQRRSFIEAMDLLFVSSDPDANVTHQIPRPSAAPPLPAGLPQSAKWEQKPDLNEIPTGKKTAALTLSTAAILSRKQVTWKGTASLRREIAPWHVYRLVEEYKVDGEPILFERKIVDPPQYRDLIPDYDPFKGPLDIPENIRRSANTFWRKYTPKELITSSIEWSIAGDASRLLGKEASGRASISGAGQFEIAFPAELVLKLSTLACDRIDVRLTVDTVPDVEILEQIKTQLFIDAVLADQEQ